MGEHGIDSHGEILALLTSVGVQRKGVPGVHFGLDKILPWEFDQSKSEVFLLRSRVGKEEER